MYADALLPTGVVAILCVFISTLLAIGCAKKKKMEESLRPAEPVIAVSKPKPEAASTSQTKTAGPKVEDTKEGKEPPKNDAKQAKDDVKGKKDEKEEKKQPEYVAPPKAAEKTIQRNVTDKEKEKDVVTNPIITVVTEPPGTVDHPSKKDDKKADSKKDAKKVDTTQSDAEPTQPSAK